ncbi:tetratricopeptide repeat protein [Lysobacter sp. HA18]
MIARTLLAAALLALAGTVSAQALPRQVEFYFDADALSQRPVLEIKDRSQTAIDRLMRSVERNAEHTLEAAQLAHFAMQTGRNELGLSLYGRAMSGMDSNNGLWRPVKWNYGWDLYRSGDAAGALREWSDLGNRGIASSWMPQTLAIALWKLGRKDDAIRWYAAAVRTEPTQWSTAAQYAQLLPQWKDDERATLAEVRAAWAANPPKWP